MQSRGKGNSEFRRPPLYFKLHTQVTLNYTTAKYLPKRKTSMMLRDITMKERAASAQCEEGRGDALRRGPRRLLCATGKLTILTGVMVSWAYANVKMYHTVHFR